MGTARERPVIKRCAFCGSSEHFRFEGPVLIDFYSTGKPTDDFWKFWCDHCDRATLVEVRGCAVPIGEHD